MSVIRHTANQIALHDRLHSGTCITIKAKVCCVTLVTPLPATPTSLPPDLIPVINAPRPSVFFSIPVSLLTKEQKQGGPENKAWSIYSAAAHFSPG